MNHGQNTGELLRKHTASQLGDELAFFHRYKREWMAKHRGEFVVLGKQTFGGFHKTYPEALQAGIRMFGPVAPFLVEEICEEAK
jgi:hypothetical protein